MASHEDGFAKRRLRLGVTLFNKERPMSEYDISIHTNPDARAWAKFFVETYQKAEDKATFIAEDNMIGWFANAMMAMHDYMRPDLAPVVLPDGSAVCVVDAVQ